MLTLAITVGCQSENAAVCVASGQDGLIADRNCDGEAAKGTLAHAEHKLTGEQPRDYAGFWVSSAGDVDSDGMDDLLVGAYGSDAGGSMAGSLYLILGHSLGQKKKIDLASADYKFTGEHSHDYAGYVASSAGDVDADGFDDILVGAPGRDDHGPTTGGAYLILGGSLGDAGTYSLSQADYEFIGEDAHNFAGYSLTSAGDVDGDGLSDVLIGASGHSSGGESAGAGYLFLGSQFADQKTLDLSESAYMFIGETPYDWAGYVVSSAGDLDGDGLSDVLLGADGDVGGYMAHASYVILGRSLIGQRRIDLADADYKIIGEESYDYASQVVGAGDVDGDGLDDIIIGAAGSDKGAPNAGAAYVVLGKSLGESRVIDLARADYMFVGETMWDFSGALVAKAGDLDGDGLGDMLIGSWKSDGQSANQGATYVILGRHLGSEKQRNLSQADYKLVGDNAWDYAGIAASCAGDVDGDGYDDILIGAYADHILHGAAYVVKGAHSR